MSASAVSSAVAPSGTAAAPSEQCSGPVNATLANYSWNGTTGADESVCAANLSDVTIYCCQQAGGSASWGLQNSSAVSDSKCGLQLCKLPSDKESDFMYCHEQKGAQGQCKNAGVAAAAANSSSAAGDKETKEKSAAPRVGPASAAMGLVFLACLGLSL